MENLSHSIINTYGSQKHNKPGINNFKMYGLERHYKPGINNFKMHGLQRHYKPGIDKHKDNNSNNLSNINMYQQQMVYIENNYIIFSIAICQ